MSKILTALKKAKLENEKGSAYNITAIATRATETQMPTYQVNKILVAVTLFLGLGIPMVVSTNSLASLEKSRHQLVQMTGQLNEQKQMIAQLQQTIQQKDMVGFTHRVDRLEQAIEENNDELTNLVIANDLLKIVVDDLKISENIFMDNYIAVNRDLKNIKKKINMEGRNL